uniref:AEC family transporter n=1 Tax=Ndongobacter massiliensis TaxID=1871025 RepID=UPI000931848E|nr:AEC family transporter [Ndongobacter massiliensis]
MAILFQQLLAMALLVGLGYVLGKKDMLHEKTGQDLSSFLMKVILPCMIFLAFDRDFSGSEAVELGEIFILNFLCMGLNILVAGLLFSEHEGIERYACVFNNKAFMGIPVVTALFGAEAVFYVTPSIVVNHLFIWTYGAAILGRDRQALTLHRIFWNPSTISFLLGLLYYVSPFRLPEPVGNALHLLRGVNTPLAMVLLGYFLCAESLPSIFQNRKAWKVSFVRLLLLPLLTVLGLWLLPGSSDFKYVMTIVWATPTAINLSMQAAMIGQDTGYAAQVTSLTTLLSLFTIPLVLQAAQWLIG